MPHDAYGIIQTGGQIVQESHGVGEAPRPSVRRQLLQPPARVPKQLSDGWLHLLGSNLVERNLKSDLR
jgi:hypothetical protein